MSKEKIFIISGEDSGDLHGAKLMASIKQVNPNTEFFGIGGNRMQKEGLQLTEHIKNLNIIGIFEVVKHYSSCLLYTSPSPRDVEESRMPSSA